MYYVEQDLMGIAALQPVYQLADGFGLIALRLEFGDELEVGHILLSWN